MNGRLSMVVGVVAAGLLTVVACAHCGSSKSGAQSPGDGGKDGGGAGGIDASAESGSPGSSDGGQAETGPLPHVVVACPSASDGGVVGQWENVTPPTVSLNADASVGAPPNYGTAQLVVDPQNTATVYLGTSGQGIYKSTDCGATWAHINTGMNGAMLDQVLLVRDQIDDERSLEGAADWCG